MSLVNKVVGIVVTLVTLYAIYLFHTRYVSVQPPRPPEVIIAQADLRCYTLLAWDDAVNEDELVFVVFAGINLAKELRVQPCDIYKQAHTIRAPGQPLHFMLWCCGRKITFVDLYATTFTGSEAWKARAAGVVEKILRDPSPFIDERPWLACVTRYIRSNFQIGAWTDKASMRRQMKLVHTSQPGSEYFCP